MTVLLNYHIGPIALEDLAKEVLTGTLTLRQLFQFICGGLQSLYISRSVIELPH